MNTEPKHLADSLARHIAWPERRIQEAFGLQRYRELVAQHIGHLPAPEHVLIAPLDDGPVLVMIAGARLYRVQLRQSEAWPVIHIRSQLLAAVSATTETTVDRDGDEGEMALSLWFGPLDSVQVSARLSGQGDRDVEKFALAILTATPAT
jgi:hypothetical protein